MESLNGRQLMENKTSRCAECLGEWDIDAQSALCRTNASVPQQDHELRFYWGAGRRAFCSRPPFCLADSMLENLSKISDSKKIWLRSRRVVRYVD